MTPSQLAMVAARIKVIFEEDAKRNSFANLKQWNEIPMGPTEPIGRSNEQAAKLVGSSETSVKRASKVLKQGIQELQKAVDTGDISVRFASKNALRIS